MASSLHIPMNAPDAVRRLLLPSLTANEARARAAVARHGQGLSLDLGAAWTLSLQPLPLGEPAAAWTHTPAWTLQVEWAGARFQLRLPEAALSRLLEARLAASRLELSALPPALATAVVEEVWSAVAAALAPLERGRARLLAATAGGSATTLLPHRFAIDAHCADNAEHFAAELATDALGLMLAAGALAARESEGRDLGAPLRARLEIGRTRLAASLLATLQPRDVLLFDQVLLESVAGAQAGAGTASRGGVTHRLWLATGAVGGLRVQLGARHLEVIEPWSALSVTAVVDPVTDVPVALDAIPVTLSFDLGEIELPLTELQQLVPGQTFDLGRPLAGAVRVRANGALVGEGELVEIDGRLGVALTHIGAP